MLLKQNETVKEMVFCFLEQVLRITVPDFLLLIFFFLLTMKLNFSLVFYLHFVKVERLGTDYQGHYAWAPAAGVAHLSDAPKPADPHPR